MLCVVSRSFHQTLTHMQDNKAQVQQQALSQAVSFTLTSQRGLLFFLPCIVWRPGYAGRGLVRAANYTKEAQDTRGYNAVERWICSKTDAANERHVENEGQSQFLLLDPQQKAADAKKPAACYFRDALASSAETQKLLLGTHSKRWPLVKILDIGGRPVVPRFTAAHHHHHHQHQQHQQQAQDAKSSVSQSGSEIPPIPAHLHSGTVVNGKLQGPGKKEAYFYPPLRAPWILGKDAPTAAKDVTRLGLRPEVTVQQLEAALDRFGLDDSLYGLMNSYPLEDNDGWTIECGVIHSPGPRLTLEVQRAQDDFNFCAWRLGEHIEDEQQRTKTREAFLLRGLPREQFVKELVAWDLTRPPDFKKQFYRAPRRLSESHSQIFWDGFYGEAVELKPGTSWQRPQDKEARPCAGLVWSGRGQVNGNLVNAEQDSQKEFLVAPGYEIRVQAAAESPLLVYLLFPNEFD